jgi:hypothetical protein
VLGEQLADHGLQRFGRQPGSLALRREGHPHLGGRGRIEAHRAVAAQLACFAVHRGELHPGGRAERESHLLGEEALGVGHRVGRVPRLVAGDVRVAAVGHERREVIGPERAQKEARGDDPRILAA